jgi:CheY-like chemotaxis protein
MESAASGAEALKAVEKRIPDLVLPAHPMPVLDGIELGAIVKAQPNPPAFVAVTSSCAAGFDVQCKAAGVDPGWRNVTSRRGCSTSCRNVFPRLGEGRDGERGV